MKTTSRIREVKIGSEQSSVLVIDDFIAQPDALVALACRQQFVANSPNYPGVRALTPPGYQQFLLQSLSPLLAEVFRLPGRRLGLSVCHFSLITTPPQQLSLLQRIPHFDTTAPDALAAVHYLYRAPGAVTQAGLPADAAHSGGTAFFRHRKTGFERITPPRELPYYRALESENNGPHLPKVSDGYMQGDTPLFEQIGLQHGVYNRIIIYPRNLLHTGLVTPQTPISGDPARGRLTISSFIDVVAG